MNFTISSTVLSNNLNTIGRVITPKNNLPIMDCFCIEIQDGKLKATASDNDTTLIATMDLNECDEDACFAVNAKILQDAIKEIPEQPLKFEFNKETYALTIRYQNGHYNLMAQNAEDYPVPVLGNEEMVEIPVNAEVLCSSLARSMVAIANDLLRPQLNAVCFDIKQNKLNMVTCNGNQLALSKMELSQDMQDGTFLLNARPATLLRNILMKIHGEVTLRFGQRGAVFQAENYKMICRLVEGRYPNYASIIPQNNTNELTVNKQALVSVLKRVLIFANPTATLVYLRIVNSTLNISSQDVEFGKSADENMICEYIGMPMNIAFKGSALLDIIQNIDAEYITIKLSDASCAGLIIPTEQKKDANVLMLLMPSVTR